MLLSCSYSAINIPVAITTFEKGGLMSRAILARGDQVAFLQNVRQSLEFTWSQIANLCGVNRRTMFNWRLEYSSLPYDTLLYLATLSGIPVPAIEAILDEDDWHSRAGRLGANVSLTKYGNPGTAAGRRAGGLAGWQKRCDNPRYQARFTNHLKRLWQLADKCWSVDLTYIQLVP
jgi:hypothetical protein